MRVAALGSPRGRTKAAKAGGASSASFTNDWRDLGFLACDVLGAPAGNVANQRLLPSEIAEHISASEGAVLRLMVGTNEMDQLDGELICIRVQDIIANLSAEAAGKEARLCLAVSLGAGSSLADTIRRASQNEIETADAEAQHRFIEQDLEGNPFLAKVRDPGAFTYRYVLIGKLVTYTLQGFRVRNSQAAPDWEFAQTDRGQYGQPPAAAIEAHQQLRAGTLEILSYADAQRSLPKRRGRVEPWSRVIGALEPTKIQKTEADLKHQAFALLSVLEMAYTAADIFPVFVHPPKENAEGGPATLRVSPRSDQGRADLSKALSLQPPAIRLSKALEADEVEGDTGWILSDVGTLGERSEKSEWRFVKSAQEGAQEVLTFEGQAPTATRDAAYLLPSGLTGQIAQFRRRARALRALREHTELLRMLADARSRIEDTQDPVEEDNQFREMDDSKQAALREILSTIPLFLLQGPPGVGKTHVVGDLVRRRLKDEPTTRILLSAQSNAAIDHLMKDVQTSLADMSPQPVMIRARPADDDGSDTDLEIDKQADILLQKLAKSELTTSIGGHLAKRIRELAAFNASNARKTTRRGPLAAEARAFEAMILRAANLVFATTNSAAIDRLIEERALFDWSMIEEAGKATGGELISPLLLSHRRLMIGDHKQLPPFGADRMIKLLSDPEQVKKAVAAAEDYISRYLREPGMEDLFEEVAGDEVDYGAMCADALRALTLFEDLLEAEFRIADRRPLRKNIARRLNEQYRMHPAIARIVAQCFYGGDAGGYKTNKGKEELYRKGTPPFRFKEGRGLPELPLVFVELPYVRSTPGYQGRDRTPTWHNPHEVEAAIWALSSLTPTGAAKPTLAVLSPYREQVKRLRTAIEAGMHDKLSNLRGFEPALGEDGFCGTVDSFQGDQADIVVVSMVRNNNHATPGKALGFLRDDRRMNVLLSRAKWRLVIVGSLEFYRNVAEFSKAIPDADIGFLQRFLQSFASAEANRDAFVADYLELSRAQK